MENFDGYYKDFKKLSCLRSYKENGFDITNFWDEEKTDETNLENVNKYEVEDILNYYDNINQIIFDPCCGSGSHCLVAKENNRLFIGCELTTEYFNVAKNRFTIDNKDKV